MYVLFLNKSFLVVHNVFTTYHGFQCVQYLGPKIWNIVPRNELKSLIKFWEPDTCPCRLWESYIAQKGCI